MDILESLEGLLATAQAQHAAAQHPEDIAYWQGKKDALRALLAEAANAPEYLGEAATSVFHFSQAQRNFTPTAPALEDLPDTPAPVVACIECGCTYFHRPGCAHGAGLSAEKFRELYAAGTIQKWLAAHGLKLA